MWGGKHLHQCSKLGLYFKFYNNRPSVIEDTTKNISVSLFIGTRPCNLKTGPTRALYSETEKRTMTNSFTLKQSDVAMTLIRNDVCLSRDYATLVHVNITNGCQSTERSTPRLLLTATRHYATVRWITRQTASRHDRGLMQRRQSLSN